MTTVSSDLEERPGTGRHDAGVAAAEPPPPTGDPLLVGLPCFIVGSIALGLVLVGYVSATAVGASLPIILAATGFGLAIAAVWSAALNQSAVASVFAIFAGFWWSYAVLVLGLSHNWFAIGAADAVHTQGLFLICWLSVIVMLTLATMRLPSAFTLLFALIDVALALVLIGTLQGSASVLKIGGIVVFAFAVVGIYLFFGSAAAATGGRALPLGPPVLR
ncbi:MAG TPA: GPR1/FUN34/YaaH family transporter [Pseudonocardiaceae bacterium]|nr:GPR1/FUN34/YaaH family transporter [Pseudonocardiaceae bacterium]